MTEGESPSIPVCWVSKEDLLSCRPDLSQQIVGLDTNDMASIADKLGDALQETYWLALEIVLTDFLGRKNTYDKPGAGST